MKKYKINFEGRLNTAIGKLYQFTKTVNAETEGAAILKLYETHEHIFIKSINGKPFDYKTNIPTYG